MKIDASKKRYHSLDGLRGIAALSVVVFHFFSAYVPRLLPGENQNLWRGTDTPFGIFYNGSFAVSIFFVLSGLVLSNSASNRHLSLWFSVVQRYFRLAVPVLAGTLLSYTLLRLYPTSVSTLKNLNDHEWLRWVYDGNLPDIFTAIRSGLFDVFVDGSSYFDNPLWTMKIELIGSVGIYAFYSLLPPRFHVPALLMVLCLCALRRPEYMGFACGALLKEVGVRFKPSLAVAYPAIVFAVVFGAMTQGYGERHGVPHLPRLLMLGEPHRFWHTAAAVAAVYSVMAIPSLRELLGSRPASFLGEISFSMYIVHVPLLYTVMVPCYRVLRQFEHGMLALLGIFLLAAIVIGYLFMLVVDRPVIAAIRIAQRAISSKRDAPIVVSGDAVISDRSNDR